MGSPAEDGGTRARLVRAVDELQRRHAFIAVPVAIGKKFGDDRGSQLASLVAHQAFLSVFPLLLCFVTATGYVLEGRPELRKELLDAALGQFPSLGDGLAANITALNGNALALTIGLAGAAWAGLGALGAMQHAMNSVWNVPLRERPGFAQATVRSVAMLIVLLVAVLATSILAALPGDGPILGVVALTVAAAMNIGLFVVTFRVLTDVTATWRTHAPGAVLAGVSFTVLQRAGSWYVERVLTSSGALYGTFAVVLGLIAWLNVQARLVVLCAEVNVVSDRHLHPRAFDQGNLTEADHRALRSYAEVEERISAEEVVVHFNDSANQRNGRIAPSGDRRR